MAQFFLIPHMLRSKDDADATEPDGKQWSPMRLMLKAPDSGQLVSARLADRLVIGRTGVSRQPDIDLGSLADPLSGVSRWHAAFLYEGAALFIEDLNSTNGTYINGYHIEAGKCYRLRNGDEIQLGRLRLIVKVVRPPG